MCGGGGGGGGGSGNGRFAPLANADDAVQPVVTIDRSEFPQFF
jgi:hypothetical protein